MRAGLTARMLAASAALTLVVAGLVATIDEQRSSGDWARRSEEVIAHTRALQNL